MLQSAKGLPDDALVLAPLTSSPMALASHDDQSLESRQARQHLAQALPNTAPDSPDIFVHDRQTGKTSRVSVASHGTQANDASYCPSISPDGRYVAFDSVANNLVGGDTNNASDIFVHDRQTGTTTRVSAARDATQGDDHSECLVLSADGRYVAFTSSANTLTPVDPNGDFSDVLVHDR